MLNRVASRLFIIGMGICSVGWLLLVGILVLIVFPNKGWLMRVFLDAGTVLLAVGLMVTAAALALGALRRESATN